MQELHPYYRQQMHNGRSKAARVIDYVLLRLLLLTASYLVLLYSLRSRMLAALVALLCVLLFSIFAKFIQDLRYARFVLKFRAKMKKVFLQESLLLLPREDFLYLCRDYLNHSGSYGAQVQHDGIVCKGACVDLLRLYGKGACMPHHVLALYERMQAEHMQAGVLISTSTLSEAARTLMQRMPLRCIHFVHPDALIAYWQSSGLTPGDDAFDVWLLEEARSMRKRFKAKNITAYIFQKEKAKRYAMCGALLSAFSFITGLNLYYQITAGVCFLLAAVCYFEPLGRKAKS
ncbi:MAG: hypothetical protein ACOYJC_00400 [Christensenellales bacterium]